MLEKIKARLAAATKGPWFVVGGDEAYIVSSPEGPITWDDHGGQVFKPEDADFIAHSPQSQEAMIGALEGVLALHVPNRGHNPECECGLEAGSGARCVECYGTYPCPTVQEITKNLSED